MKKSILNLGAIAIAFCLGISIHNSCADPDNYNTTRGDASTEELWAAIDALTAEVNTLKSKIQTLENNAGSGSDSGDGEFYVGGLWFNRSGQCSSKLKSITTSGDNMSSSKTEYEYDSNGRVSRYTTNSAEVTITYDGKVQTWTSLSTNPVDGSVSTYVQTYLYN